MSSSCVLREIENSVVTVADMGVPRRTSDAQVVGTSFVQMLSLTAIILPSILDKRLSMSPAVSTHTLEDICNSSKVSLDDMRTFAAAASFNRVSVGRILVNALRKVLWV